MTTVEQTRPLLQPVLQDVFLGSWGYTTVVSVAPQSCLCLHIDGEVARTRHILVVQTTPESWAFHDGTWAQLAVGGIYTMDPTKPHGGVNWGDLPRIHITVECEGVTDARTNHPL